MNNGGVKGGESHKGHALKMGQRGLFQRYESLEQSFDVTQRLLVGPRPQVMLTWLFEGVQCGLRQNPFGKRNFKIMIVII